MRHSTLRELLSVSLTPWSRTTSKINVDRFATNRVHVKNHGHLLSGRYGVAGQSCLKPGGTTAALECEGTGTALNLPLAKRIIPANNNSLHVIAPYFCYFGGGEPAGG
jgi:hypothetical protein